MNKLIKSLLLNEWLKLRSGRIGSRWWIPVRKRYWKRQWRGFPGDGWIFNAKKRVETMEMLTSCPDEEMMMNLVSLSYFQFFRLSLFFFFSFFFFLLVPRSPFKQNVLLDWEELKIRRGGAGGARRALMEKVKCLRGESSSWHWSLAAGCTPGQV